MGLMAGDEGFEPPNGGTRTHCLTAWRIPNAIIILSPYFIKHKFKFCAIIYTVMIKLTSGEKCENKSLSLSLLAAVVLIFLVNLFLFKEAGALADYKYSISADITELSASMDLSPESELKVMTQKISLDTDSPHGVRVFLSTSDSKSIMYEKIKRSDYPIKISETTGTYDSPAVLQDNSYGFALAKEEGELFEKFSEREKYKNSDNDALFAKIWTDREHPGLIYRGGSKSNLEVYYGAKVNSLIDQGEYITEITYTIVSDFPKMIEEHDETMVQVVHNETYPGGPFFPRLNLKTNGPIKRMTRDDDYKIYLDNFPTWRYYFPTAESFAFASGPSDTNSIRLFQVSDGYANAVPSHDFDSYDLTIEVPKYGIKTTKKRAIKKTTISAMQDFSHNDCKSLLVGQIISLYDNRDNKKYLIQKLADGNCWMTNNLNYVLDKNVPLKPEDSDISAEWYPEFNSDSSQGEWGVDNGRSLVDPARNNKNDYIGYYSFAAATAGSGVGLNPGNNAPGSICPKGWRLPTAGEQGSTNDFRTLYQKYYNEISGVDGQKFQFDAAYKRDQLGIYDSDRGLAIDYYGYNDGNYGYFGLNKQNNWQRIGPDGYEFRFYLSSTAADDGGVYLYHYKRSKRKVSYNAKMPRNFGYNVRCVKRGEESSSNYMGYMQEFKSEMCNKMSTHQTATLKDKRDNETYAIAKLKDGNCWMTQNLRLRLDVNKTLAPSDTDIPSNWTPVRSTVTALNGSWTDGKDSYYDSDKPENGVYYANGLANKVCPKGWKNPTISEYKVMQKEYKGSAIDNGMYINGPNEMFGVPGFIGSGYVTGHGSRIDSGCSRLWPDDRYKDVGVCTDIMYAGGGAYTYDGFSVRCMSR